MKSFTAALLGEIVEKAQTAVGANDLQRGILETLAPSLPFDFCAWTPTPFAERSPLYVGAGDAVRHAADLFVRSPARYYESRFVARLEAAGGASRDRDICTPTELDAHPIYSEVFRPIEMRSVLICSIHFQGRRLSGITFGRGGRRAGFALRDVERVRSIRAVLGLVESAFLSIEGPPSLGAMIGAMRDRGLSGREVQVAGLIARGMQNKEIAALLGTSPATVQKQTMAIYRKTGVSSRAQLVARLAGLEPRPPAAVRLLPIDLLGRGPSAQTGRSDRAGTPRNRN